MKSLGETRHEQAIMAVLIAVTALFPVVVVLAHRGAGIMILAMGLAVATRAEPWAKGVPKFLLRPDFRDPLVVCALSFLAFCVWIFLTGFWSPQGLKPALALGVFLPVIAAGAVVWEIGRRPPDQCKALAKVYGAAVVLAALLVAVEALNGAPLRDLTPPEDLSPERFKDMTAVARGISLAALALVPGAALVASKSGLRGFRKGEGPMNIPLWEALSFFVLAFALAYGSIDLGVVSNAAALGAGVLAAAAAIVAPRASLAAIAFGLAGLFVVAPFAAAALPVETLAAAIGDAAPVSWIQRLYAWRAAGEAAFQCAPLGCGADAARSVYAAGETVEIADYPLPLKVMPTHPHNLFVQVAMELGVAGPFFAVILIISGWLSVLNDKILKQFARRVAAIAAMFAMLAFVEASLWQVWRFGGLGVAVAGIALLQSVNQSVVYSRGGAMKGAEQASDRSAAELERGSS